MGLAEICAAFKTRLEVIPGFDQVTIEPPAQLPDDRMLIITPNPGDAKPYAHASEAGRPVVECNDKVVIEAHYKIAQDQIGAAIAWATPMLDTVRNAIWLGYHADQMGGSITLLRTVTTDRYGGLGWGTDPTFGFVLTLDLMHAEEVL